MNVSQDQVFAHRVRYHGSYLKGSHLWIIMEYCSGGSCSDLVSLDFDFLRAILTDTRQMKSGVFREEYIAILLRELLRGLEYLHSEGKLHRDIKGEKRDLNHRAGWPGLNSAAANILLTSNGDVKLADFGVSGQLTATMTKKVRFVDSNARRISVWSSLQTVP